jgi:hypothetical protein
VIGRGTLADAREATVSGKNVAGRPIIVHRCDAAANIGPCHVLLVAAQDRARDALAAVNGKPVLAVGDGDAFLPAGGTIRFFTENNKMRFEVSQSAAARAKLKISSKLLGLARLYSDGK